MTCENCIHCDVCEEHGMKWSGGILCYNFKDKSRFVELPCSIGSTVYEIVPECEGISCPFNGGYGTDRCKSTLLNKNYDLCKAYIHERKFSFCDKDRIGKDIFLTREEVEKVFNRDMV